jgi:hypothetical protein
MTLQILCEFNKEIRKNGFEIPKILRVEFNSRISGDLTAWNFGKEFIVIPS